MASIQGGASLAKRIIPAVGAPGATTLRLTFASIALLSLWRPWRARLRREDYLKVAAYGASLGGMNLLFYLALARLPLGLTVAIEFIGPLAVSFGSSRKPIDFLWGLLAAGGVALILPLGPIHPGAVDLLGIALAAGAGGFWALYILFGQRAGARMSAGVATSLGMTAAFLVTLPFGIAEAGTRLFDPAVLPIGLAVGLLSSALPYSLEMIALKRMRAQSFGILMSLEPAIAALFGLVWLHEHLEWIQWAAIFCIVIASLGSAACDRPSIVAAEPPVAV